MTAGARTCAEASMGRVEAQQEQVQVQVPVQEQEQVQVLIKAGSRILRPRAGAGGTYVGRRPGMIAYDAGGRCDRVPGRQVPPPSRTGLPGWV